MVRNDRGKSGTTSACAENTVSDVAGDILIWNYLRVRGEYKPLIMNIIAPAELPPRARRILYGTMPSACFPGTTSACAENTFP